VLLFVICFITFVLRVFFNSPTQFHLWKQDWVMCCSFVIPTLRLVLEYFSTVPILYPWKQGLSDVLLFVIPFFVFGLKSIFQQSHPILPMKAGIEWCAAPVILFLTCLVLRVFFNSPTQFYPWKQGLSDVLPFVIPLVFGLKSIFNSPTQFLPMKAGIEWCAAPLITFGLVIFFNSPTQFLPMKAGIEWCAALCDSFLYVWS
jgi:hypothetical protein